MQSADRPIREQGAVWNDTNGNPINAHGGGILFYEGKYFWYGEVKSGKTILVPNQSWECYRVDVGGVSCYSSENLIDWTYEGIVLAPNVTDSTHDLHLSKVVERPKVIYNDMTKKFVMWLHIDAKDYQLSLAGVAISDSPLGPFEYLGSLFPNGFTSRDMTLFKDDDGKAYHIFASEKNATMHISLLTADYLKPSGVYKRVLIDQFREAPAMFKHNRNYYLITSGCTGWSPNAAMLASADSVLGNWSIINNPCIGENSDSTFLAQGTYVLPLPNRPDNFIFMADRWEKADLENSRYVWLPFVVKGDSIEISWEKHLKVEL